MKLKLSKCHFAAAELPFVGCIAERFELKMYPAKVNKLKLIKFPVDKKQGRQFLSLAGFGYFRDLLRTLQKLQPHYPT